MMLKLLLKCFFCYCFMISVNYAEMIKLQGKTVISKTTTYKNVTLDLTEGYFSVINNATLTIDNSTIHGVISPANPKLIEIVKGNLLLKKNKFRVRTDGITPNPPHVSLYNAISMNQGTVNIDSNDFTMDTYFTAGLLVTNKVMTSNFIIRNNKVRNFHGGFYLINTNNALIENNAFWNTSISNIYILSGSNNILQNNVMLFSGNNNLGDGIDLIDSDHIQVQHNSIYSDSCYALVIMRCQDILIDNNIIADGITYGIYITTNMGYESGESDYLIRGGDQLPYAKDPSNRNIIITNNYLLQNRYGLGATQVSGLTVENNLFMQRFLTAARRKFWTNNDVVLKQVENVSWKNNRYRESFSQIMGDDNTESTKFVVFPKQGGVEL